jgi:hypothetical protein
LVNGRPHWVTMLKEAKLHQAWIDDLQDLAIRQCSLERRVGGVLDASKSLLGREIRLYINSKVPLWIAYRNGAPPKDKFFAKWQLSVVEKQAANQAEEKSDALSGEGVEACAKVEQYSRQREGENWKDFFERERADNERWLERVSEEQKRKRSMREDIAAKGIATKKATVFHWEDVGGFRIQKRLSRKNTEGLWGGYRRDQKRYNSVRDKWDICSDWGEDVETRVPQMEDDYDDNEDVYYYLSECGGNWNT